MSAAKSRSITWRSSSTEPSRLTIEWSSGMTIFTRVTLLPDEAPRFAESLESRVNCLSPPGRSGARLLAMLSAGPHPGRASSGWPGQRPAAQHVRVHMLDCLPSLRAGIEDNPVSRLVDSGRHGDLVRLSCDLFQQASARPGQLGKIGVVIFWYDKHMGRRLRADIAERYRARALQHAHHRGLARRDAAEETVAHATILTCDASARLPTYMVALLRILGCSREQGHRQDHASCRGVRGLRGFAGDT